jgi:hypothetical protein
MGRGSFIMSRLRSDAKQESASIGWFFLGLFLPIVGLILFLVWIHEQPAKAKRSGIGALSGCFIGIMAAIIFGVFVHFKVTSHVTSSSATTSSKIVSSQNHTTIAWNKTKDHHLSEFMQSFAKAKHQNYTIVSSTSKTQWYSKNLSTAIKHHLSLTVDDAHQSANWFPSAKHASAKATNIIAAYADSKKHRLYLFTLKANGTGKVLIAQDAIKNGRLSVRQTKNEQLKTGYQQILKGNPAAFTNNASSQQSTSSAAKPKPVFPSNFIGTWYGWSYGKQYTVIITENSIAFDDKPLPVHWQNEHTKADKQLLMSNSDISNEISESPHACWQSAMLSTAPGANVPMISLRGWFQTAGAGEFYWVESRDLNGTQQPVLAMASGAQEIVDTNFYQTPQLADQYKDTIFSDEPTTSNYSEFTLK